MSLYLIQVVCIGEKPGKKLGSPWKAVRCYMDALVDALGADEAMEVGRNFIEAQAPSDARWHEFTALKAAPVTLPVIWP